MYVMYPDVYQLQCSNKQIGHVPQCSRAEKRILANKTLLTQQRLRLRLIEAILRPFVTLVTLKQLELKEKNEVTTGYEKLQKDVLTGGLMSEYKGAT